MKARPDIVFICSDQWNARYLRCAGHPQVQTPHLDALAATGCIFDAAYTPSPVCMPARASLASGLYPHAHGIFGFADTLQAIANPLPARARNL